MAAYLVMQIAISDADQWRKYREAVVPLITGFGGKHMTKSGGFELLEGRDDGRRIAIFEFTSMDAIHAFWDSPEYIPVKELRRGAAILDVWAVPGI